MSSFYSCRGLDAAHASSHACHSFHVDLCTDVPLSQTSFAGTRDYRASTSACGASAHEKRATADHPSRSVHLELTISSVSAGDPVGADCKAGNHHQMAPTGISVLLALPLQAGPPSLQGEGRAAATNLSDVQRERRMGGGTHSWRTTETWLQDHQTNGRQVSKEISRAAHSRLADILTKS